MAKPKIHTAKYVKASELFDELTSRLLERLQSIYARGDGRKSLVGKPVIRKWLDLRRLDEEDEMVEWALLDDLLATIPDGTLIDIEN